MSKQNRKYEEQKRKKAKKLLEISTKVHNELRPYMKLGTEEEYRGMLTCQQVQETIQNMVNGESFEVDIAEQAITHTKECDVSHEILEMLSVGKPARD